MKGQLTLDFNLGSFFGAEDGEDNWLVERFKYWILETPDPGSNEEDNVWSDFHLFDDEWVEVQNRLDWYESPNVPTIYKDHKYIFKQNMDMGRPEEIYYKQNIDSGKFRSHLIAEEDLPSSSSGKVRIISKIRAKTAPSGENNFCLVQYNVNTEMKYDLPNGINFMPRILARPINRLMKWVFFLFVGEEIVDRDGEYALERTTEYFQYLRKYHGEEPTQTKSRQAEFTPLPEDGIFFE